MDKKQEYWKKLQDPRWQKKRLEIMERDEFTCRCCDDNESTLNVHHAYYVKGRDPWEYPCFSLTTLCKNCHENRHLARRGDQEFQLDSWEWTVENFFGCQSDEYDQFRIYELSKLFFTTADAVGSIGALCSSLESYMRSIDCEISVREIKHDMGIAKKHKQEEPFPSPFGDTESEGAF